MKKQKQHDKFSAILANIYNMSQLGTSYYSAVQGCEVWVVGDTDAPKCMLVQKGTELAITKPFKNVSEAILWAHQFGIRVWSDDMLDGEAED
ncbi:hypothetical protein [Rhizobacter sp. Root404]|uniref:hypothetical protein n=1 Tax=Rhizobacter sp. Root404 TaxID=1736528 RepID=UPI0006FFF306|nr:hypothetical protein [Rhizobacter sp. Root404]KQW36745.1 hypothetical protein ASC76_19100 [Rhizobacter sp. Root404]